MMALWTSVLEGREKMEGKLVILNHVTFIEDDAFPRGIEEKRGRKIYGEKEHSKRTIERSHTRIVRRDDHAKPLRGPHSSRLIPHVAETPIVEDTRRESSRQNMRENLPSPLPHNKQASLPKKLTIMDTRSVSRPVFPPLSPWVLARIFPPSPRVPLRSRSDNKVMVFPRPISSATMPPFIA